MHLHRFRLLAVVSGIGYVLVALTPRWGAVAEHVAHPHRWVTTVGADAAVVELASAALWLAAAWLAVGLVAAGGSALPGTIGRLAEHVARRLLPHTVYRLAAGAVGVGVLLSPVAAGAVATPGSGPIGHSRATPAPAWPTDDPVPAPAWPTTGATRSRPPHGTPPQSTPPHRTSPTPTPPTPTPPTPTPPTPTPASHESSTPAPHPRNPTPTTRPGTQPAPRPDSVVVQQGDSLWSIAAAHEPAPSSRRVAAEWPRWFAANRRVIGSDPDRIVPGQVLHAPIKEDHS